MKHQLMFNTVEVLYLLDGLNPDHFDNKTDKAKAEQLRQQIFESVRKDLIEREAKNTHIVTAEFHPANAAVCPACDLTLEVKE